MNDHDFAKEVRRLVHQLDDGGPMAIDGVIEGLKAAGAVRGCNMREDLSKSEELHWYAGQVLDVLESGALFAVNSIINCLDRFAPDPDAPVKKQPKKQPKKRRPK